MTTQMIICFAISAVVIAGYIWNKLSVGTVGCIGIVLFLLTGCMCTRSRAMKHMDGSSRL